jgi:peptidoglycan/xylan/chitin deacetylase (PgdA/CDA1 family)
MRRADAVSAQGLAESRARIAIREAVTRQKALPTYDTIAILTMLEDGLSRLAVKLPASYGDDRFLSWAELSQLAESPLVTIGSHSTTHVPLTRLTSDEVAAELAASRAALESRLSRRVEWFAYPNGDHDAASIELVRQAGYRGAFTTLDGPTAVRGHRFALNRINVHEGATRTVSRFVSRIAGVL